MYLSSNVNAIEIFDFESSNYRAIYLILESNDR